MSFRNSWTLDACVGHWAQNAGRWTLDTGLWASDAEHWTERWTLDVRTSILNSPKVWKQQRYINHFIVELFIDENLR